MLCVCVCVRVCLHVCMLGSGSIRVGGVRSPLRKASDSQKQQGLVLEGKNKRCFIWGGRLL